MVNPPNRAYQMLQVNKLYKTVNSPTKLKVEGKATDANTNNKNIEVNLGFAILGGTTIILGAYYMLKMFQHAMLGENNARPFADVTFSEGFVLVVISVVLFFFGLYSKPITDLITPSLENILTHINR